MRILSAMSGGVDSSVATALLCAEGHEVAGATLKLYESEDNRRDIEDARRVCERLGIEHIVLDMRELFEREIIGRFAEGYARGITPNPCLDCNRHIKFGALLDEARRRGFSKIATGHYAKIERDEQSGRYLLKKSAEQGKDQTYVLYSLTQDVLKSVMFPLGNIGKNEVRRIAADRGFGLEQKKESQDICFIKNDDYIGFLEKHCAAVFEPGDFVDREGRVVGRHAGHMRYTNGQRRGLNLSLGRPVYVTGKDANKNLVMIGDEGELYSSSVIVKEPNFIPFERLESPMRVTAKLRYSQNAHPAVICPEGNIVRIEFVEPQRAATPGQAAVFYEGDIVVGGGRIV